ncbi:hypothetical protein C2S52_020279 [Perilla frutescens var. hirtella]|uniref:Uncharacterized protein n=1 Tax=Perilla frutescens var. hirtella TaxID=608512 RepID=A0AAD4PFM4_PERFH|nr:hypothetical protein C2S52_020279 [Perilla frutescens var. hirtella]KAH6802244.1 hypothetical protein C2S51_033690 [Perilla frutescens var. frutescens]KAH6805503.1 hypothetical protein C2S51_030334 [Perilla frutescens var. frutescens]KAH6837476.1 hypothetical protein C2S53_018191 [Perilla frutescens var. hirtella]
MGRSVPSAQNLHQFARVIASPKNGSRRPAQLKPTSSVRPISSPDPTEPLPDSRKLRVSTRRMEAAENSERQRRTPLAAVVSDCARRWFQDALKEAKNGDTAMQVLVGQMYTSGYGIVKDEQKGRAWINRASRSRTSVWKVGDKHPGYNASDSDSDDAKEDAK